MSEEDCTKVLVNMKRRILYPETECYTEEELQQLGYNPMRWRCQDKGCYNQMLRPRIEIYAPLFPGKINFTDVDSIVELNGNSLILEWKSNFEALPHGQFKMFQRLSKNSRVDCICIVGNSWTMDITHLASFMSGEWQSWKPANREDLWNKIDQWVEYAVKNPFLTNEEPKWTMKELNELRFSRQSITQRKSLKKT